ncbi:MAG: tetratricopeptide repeat protein [Planctomycetota bacterium]
MFNASRALLLLPLATACASSSDGVRSDADEPAFASDPVEAVSTEAAPAGAAPGAAMPVPASAPRTAASNPTAPAAAPKGGIEATIWASERFKRRFANSYLAVTDVEPRVTADEREQMLEIMELITEEELGKAIKEIRKSKEKSSNAVFDFTLGNIHYQRDEMDAAAAAYRRAATEYPNFRRAWQMLGQVLVRQGDYEGALPALIEHFELGGSDAISYGLLGVAHTNTGNYLAGESAFRMAALLDPATLDWKKGLADCFFRQGRFHEAVALLDGLIAEDPSRPEFWLLQANAYIRLEQPLKAAENYELVESLGGSTVDSLYNLGDIYVNQGLADVAVAAYLRALELNDEAPLKRVVRAAKAINARGSLAEARRIVEGIEATRGDNLDLEIQKDLLKLRARIAVAEGAGDEEVEVLKETIALDPLDGEALILLAQHSTRIGENEQAIFYYERAAAIDDFEAEAKMRHGELLVNLGRYAEALPLLRRTQDLKPREFLANYIDQVETASKR